MVELPLGGERRQDVHLRTAKCTSEDGKYEVSRHRLGRAWFTIYITNGGCTVTGPNGNSIYLPATGRLLSNEITNKGTAGYYWTRSRSVEKPAEAYHLIMYDDSRFYNSTLLRSYGIYVRAVAEK